MRDLARTIYPQASTPPKQGKEFLARERWRTFNRTKRKLMKNLPSWAVAVGMPEKQAKMLGQIIYRCAEAHPWEWRTKYGVARTTTEFGMQERTFRKVVKALTDSGDLIVVKVNKTTRIYRVSPSTLNAIQGRGNVTLSAKVVDTNLPEKRPSGPERPTSSDNVRLPKPASLQASRDVNKGITSRYSNSSSSSRSRWRRRIETSSSKEERRSSGAVNQGGVISMVPRRVEPDDTPVMGRDPARVDQTEQSGTATGHLARYFETQWEQVAPTRREAEALWPMKPWSVGKKAAFMGWLKNVLLRDVDLTTAMAMVDEFCQHHERYFSPYRNGAVWNQFNWRADKLKRAAVHARPSAPPEVDEATMEARRAQDARDEVARQRRRAVLAARLESEDPGTEGD